MWAAQLLIHLRLRLIDSLVEIAHPEYLVEAIAEPRRRIIHTHRTDALGERRVLDLITLLFNHLLLARQAAARSRSTSCFLCACPRSRGPRPGGSWWTKAIVGPPRSWSPPPPYSDNVQRPRGLPVLGYIAHHLDYAHVGLDRQMQRVERAGLDLDVLAAESVLDFCSHFCFDSRNSEAAMDRSHSCVPTAIMWCFRLLGRSSSSKGARRHRSVQVPSDGKYLQITSSLQISQIFIGPHLVRDPRKRELLLYALPHIVVVFDVALHFFNHLVFQYRLTLKHGASRPRAAFYADVELGYFFVHVVLAGTVYYDVLVQVWSQAVRTWGGVVGYEVGAGHF